MQTQMSRREALAGIGFIGTASTGMWAAIAYARSDGDEAILAAWDRRQAALAVIEANGPYFDAETDSPEAAAIYDEADVAIAKATATTPRGLLVQAWVAASYVQDSFNEVGRRQNAMIRRADYAGLLGEGAYLDWELQTQLAVIRSLRAMTGEG
jgi:hypothetical protein